MITHFIICLIYAIGGLTFSILLAMLTEPKKKEL